MRQQKWIQIISVLSLFLQLIFCAVIPPSNVSNDLAHLPTLTTTQIDQTPCGDATKTVTKLYDIRRDSLGYATTTLESFVTQAPKIVDKMIIEVGCGQGVQTNTIILDHDLPGLESFVQATNLLRYTEKKKAFPWGKYIHIF